ncbi:MAG TPA: hypothetical protein PKD54_03215, partial [Pirellulaceae bacterium]|nr:hypothetical protein [Pirellulaceae bacterium]
MTCTEFERIAQQLMDQRQPLDSEPHLVSHVEKCTTCARRFEQFQRLEEMVLSVYGLPPLHGEHRLEIEKPISVSHTETYWKSHASNWRGSVAAAAVVLMFSVWLAWPLGHVSKGPT